MPLYEALVEGGVGIRRAVRRDEQLCTVEIRRVDGHELYLYGPLGKTALAFLGCAAVTGRMLDAR